MADQPAPASALRILILRRDNIGDLVCTTPLIAALRGQLPVARWRPWGVAHRVVRPESGDLADLAFEPVLDAIGELGTA